MQNSIFECPICYNTYDNCSKPLTLPCGHVYCSQCLLQICRGNTIICPADKITHNAVVNDLPCCYAIMANLPKQKVKGFLCKRHSKKKIKFVCEKHSEYLCTLCVLDHTGVGHKVVSFKIDYKSIENNMQQAQAKINTILTQLNIAKNEIRESDAKLQEAATSQESEICSAYDNAMQKIKEKRVQLLTKNKRMYDEQKQIYDETNQQNSKFKENVKNLSDVSSRLKGSKISCYVDYIKILDSISTLISQCDMHSPQIKPLMPLFDGINLIR